MPQPLSKLLKPKVALGFEAELPLDKPELCARAMNIVALWSLVDRATSTIVVSITPGKAAPIASLFLGSNADSPKKAIRDALAASMLTDDELTAFKALMVKYETCYKLRNPLAHWVLGRCIQVPDAIIAINPKTYVQINADHESIIDQMLTEISDPNNSHIEDEDDRITAATKIALASAFQKHVETMYAYRESDLKGIEKTLEELVQMLDSFRILVRMRFLKLDRLKYSIELQVLFHRLGLPLPKAGKA